MIPERLRETYGLEPGDEVVWVDGRRLKKRTRISARGLSVPDDTSEGEREEIAEGLETSLRDRRDRNYEG